MTGEMQVLINYFCKSPTNCMLCPRLFMHSEHNTFIIAESSAEGGGLADKKDKNGSVLINRMGRG